MAIEQRRRAVAVSCIKAVKNNPLCSCCAPPSHVPPSRRARRLPHLMLFPYLLLASEKERIGERRERERERICSNGLLWRQISGEGGGARENYGEKLALSPSAVVPLFPSDDDRRRGRQADRQTEAITYKVYPVHLNIWPRVASMLALLVPI